VAVRIGCRGFRYGSKIGAKRTKEEDASNQGKTTLDQAASIIIIFVHVMRDRY
jgi:hypothetical protein